MIHGQLMGKMKPAVWKIVGSTENRIDKFNTVFVQIKYMLNTRP